MHFITNFLPFVLFSPEASPGSVVSQRTSRRNSALGRLKLTRMEVADSPEVAPLPFPNLNLTVPYD